MMNIILFGSSLNPLSAVAADYFYKQGQLKFIVVASSRIGKIGGGWGHRLSLIIVGMYRFFNIFLRRIGVRQSANYTCLYEFTNNNKGIPYIELRGEVPEINLIIRKLGKIDPKEYMIVSCVFPYKIPLGICGIEKSINIHPAPLPKYRGSSPYFWILANREGKSAVTFHVLSDRFDEGNLLYMEEFNINKVKSEYALEKASVSALKKALPCFFRNIDELWNNQKKQGNLSCYRQPTFLDRKRYKRYSVFF